jgi:hypothetical protein
MMNRIIALCVLLAVSGFAASALARKPQPEIMGVRLGMSREEAHARLKKKGSLEKEARKRQEVWAVSDRRISHLLVGFDPDFRVRYVTAIARANAPRIRYAEVADVKIAQQTNNQGNYKFTWEVSARPKQPAYLVMAHGRDPQHLDSYSIKKLDNEGID